MGQCRKDTGAAHFKSTTLLARIVDKGLGYAARKLTEQKSINRIHDRVYTAFPQVVDGFFGLQEIMQRGRHHRHTGTGRGLANPIESG